MIHFVRELNRRRVIRGGAIYIILAWLALQVIDLLTEPADPLRRLALYWAIGLFPLALVFSWVFRMVPGALDQELHGEAHPPRTWHGKALNIAAGVGLAIVVAVEAGKRLI